MSAARPRLSGCVIAKDEADRIGACLDSLKFCDEILVLDSGSTDGTQDLARAKGARVIETDWPGWVKQKNRAADAAQFDWILSLDADERVDDALRASIEGLRDGGLDAEAGPAAYEVCRRVNYLGKWIRHGGWYPEWRARLFHRTHARWGGVDPHDRLESKGAVERIRDGHLEHYTYRSIQDHFRQMLRFSEVGARELHARGRKASVVDLVFRPAWRFVYMYFVRCGFLDGRAGYLLARLGATTTFLKYAQLSELTREAASVDRQ